MGFLNVNVFSVKAKFRFPHGYFWMECGYEYRPLCGAFCFCNSSLAGCEFQAAQKCLTLMSVYAINFIP
jgi:hypothetical protein